MIFTTTENYVLRIEPGDTLVIKWYGYDGSRIWSPWHCETVYGVEDDAVLLEQIFIEGKPKPAYKNPHLIGQSGQSVRRLPTLTSKGKATSQILDSIAPDAFRMLLEQFGLQLAR